jgi:hypothetical protein
MKFAERVAAGFHGGWTRAAFSGIVWRVGFDEDHYNL